MQRSTRNLVLGLLGSTALFGCCLLPGCDSREEEVRDEKGNVVAHRRHYYYHPWFYSSGGRGWNYYTSYGSPYYGGSSYAPTSRTTSGTTSGGSRPSSGVTSHGGFGSTGSATAG